MANGEYGHPGRAATSHAEMDISGEGENVTIPLHQTMEATAKE